jgi:hypothetical protein
MYKKNAYFAFGVYVVCWTKLLPQYVIISTQAISMYKYQKAGRSDSVLAELPSFICAVSTKFG